MSEDRKKITKSYWKKLNQDRARALKNWPPDKIKKKEIEWRDTLEKKLKAREVKGYFNWSFLDHIPFYFFIVISTRNNGKTFATFRLIEKYTEQGKIWMILRNKAIEVTALISSLRPWLSDNGWEAKIKSGEVFDKKTKKTVGWIKALSQAYVHKSNEFNASLIVFDEFMGKKKDKDQFLNLMNYSITAQRQNPDFKLLLLSNNCYNDNDILSNLSLNFSKNELTFNFLSKAVLWKVPENTFEEFREVTNASFLSTLSSKESYEANYGKGNFREDISNLEPLDFLNYNDVHELIIIENHFEIILKRDSQDNYYLEKLEANELTAEENKDVRKITTNRKLINKTYNIELIELRDLIKIAKLWEDEEINFRGSASIRDKLKIYFQDVIIEEFRTPLTYEVI